MGPGRALKLLSQGEPEGRLRLHELRVAGPGPPRARVEFCENGARAVALGGHDALTVPTSFWAEHSLTDLLDRSEYWLGQQGRLVEPVHKPAGSDHYVPISWDDAFRLVAEQAARARLARPGGVLHQRPHGQRDGVRLPAVRAGASAPTTCPTARTCATSRRAPRCSRRVGIGKSTVAYDDFAQADLIIVMGQNPGTNHPRMLTALEDAKRHGASIVAVNPLPEAGLRRYKNPQTVRGHRRPRHRPGRPVPADPQRRRHGPAAVASRSASWRPRTAPRARCSTTTSSPSTRWVSTSSGRTSPTLDEQEVLARHRPDARPRWTSSPTATSPPTA